MPAGTQVIQQIKNVVAADLAANASRIKFFTNGAYKGGWECWLQVEVARAVIAADMASDFNREEQYTIYTGGIASLSVQRADLYLKGKAGGTSAYVELKTQRNNAYATTLTDFEADIKKLRNLGAETNGKFPFVAAAVLTAPATPRTAMDTLRNTYAGHVSYFNYVGGAAPWPEVTPDIRTRNLGANTMILATWKNAL